jgi:hypothetical protein
MEKNTKQTIKSVLLEMKLSVELQENHSPNWWIDKALMLNVLWQDLKESMTKFEMVYKSEVVELIEQGKKISEAERIVEAKSENYKMFKYLQGRDKIVDEFIKLAKCRAKIENNFE